MNLDQQTIGTILFAAIIVQLAIITFLIALPYMYRHYKTAKKPNEIVKLVIELIAKVKLI